MSDKYVINPSTGRSVKLGGKAYRTLIKEGKIKNMPFEKQEARPKKAMKPTKPTKPIKQMKSVKQVPKIKEKAKKYIEDSESEE